MIQLEHEKNHGKVTFKPYSQEQAMLLPSSLEELIPECLGNVLPDQHQDRDTTDMIDAPWRAC